MKKLVYIVSGNWQYKSMFLEAGWDITLDLAEADLVQFTGGEDVSPDLYGERSHPRTFHNPNRDKQEKRIFDQARELGLPMAGICRGGQFLNVMNGGKMYQDVDNHAIGGTHKAHVNGFIGDVDVTSTHHQMMRPNLFREHIVLMSAKLATRKEYMGGLPVGRVVHKTNEDDVESIYYPETRTLCFQPHPEFDKGKHCRAVYFFFINNYLLPNISYEKASNFVADSFLHKVKTEDYIPY